MGLLSADSAVVVVEISPLIIRIVVGIQRQTGLDTVLQALDQNLGVLLAAIEYELQVGGLAYLEVLEVVLELVGVRYTLLGHVDSHQNVERPQVGVMSETQ